MPFLRHYHQDPLEQIVRRLNHLIAKLQHYSSCFSSLVIAEYTIDDSERDQINDLLDEIDICRRQIKIEFRKVVHSNVARIAYENASDLFE